MYTKLLACLIHCLDAADCFKCNLGLEIARKILALCFIHYLLLLQQVTLLIHCPKMWVHYSFHWIKYCHKEV